MTIEELLKPRREVIAPYPCALYNVGYIIENVNIKSCPVLEGEAWHVDLDDYPNLFRPLEWWEGRDVKDMPQYVKFLGETDLNPYDKILKWDMSSLFGYTSLTTNTGCSLTTWQRPYGYIPATREEYEAQQSQH